MCSLPKDAHSWGDHKGEERLIGWGGETYDSRAQSGSMPNAVTLAAQDRERGTWVEPISWYPRAFHLHNIMSTEECDKILEIARPRVRRSTVIDSVTGESKVDPIRTSEQTFLNRGRFPIVTTIEVRRGWEGSVNEKRGVGRGQREREMGRGRQEPFRHSRRARSPPHAPTPHLFFCLSPIAPTPHLRGTRRPASARVLSSASTRILLARRARCSCERRARLSRDDLPSSFRRINQEPRRLTYAPKTRHRTQPASRSPITQVKSIHVIYSVLPFTCFFAPSAPAGCLFASHAALIPTVVRRSSSEGALTSQERLARYTYLPAYHGEDLQVLRYAFGRGPFCAVSSGLVYRFAYAVVSHIEGVPRTAHQLLFYPCSM